MWVHFTFTPQHITASSIHMSTCILAGALPCSRAPSLLPTSLLLLMFLILEQSTPLPSCPELFFMHELTQVLPLSEILPFFHSHFFYPYSETFQYL